MHDVGGDNGRETETERQQRIVAEARAFAYSQNDEGNDNSE